MSYEFYPFGQLLVRIVQACKDKIESKHNVRVETLKKNLLDPSIVPEIIRSATVKKTEYSRDGSESYDFDYNVCDELIDEAIHLLHGVGAIQSNEWTALKGFKLADGFVDGDYSSFDFVSSLSGYNAYIVRRIGESYLSDSIYDFKNKAVQMDHLLYVIKRCNVTAYGFSGDSFLNAFIQDVVSKVDLLLYGQQQKKELLVPDPEADEPIGLSMSERILEKIKNLTPEQFEKLGSRIMAKIVFSGLPESLAISAMRHTGRSGDGGIDGVVTKNDPIEGSIKYYIQCKRYKDKSVQSPEIRNFIGALEIHKARAGIFATTSSFSEGARKTAESSDNFKIKLMQGSEIVQFMIEHRMGVMESKQEIIAEVLDEEFFLNL